MKGITSVSKDEKKRIVESAELFRRIYLRRIEGIDAPVPVDENTEKRLKDLGYI